MEDQMNTEGREKLPRFTLNLLVFLPNSSLLQVVDALLAVVVVK